jgi:carbon-monoxide dehydrogenase large subunit
MTSDKAAVEGTWAVTIHGPTGPQETILELNSTDGTLGGSQSAMGQVEKIVEISWNSATGDLMWVNKIKKPLPLSLKFQGQVEGSTMSGKVATGIMGSFPFTAVRREAPPA